MTSTISALTTGGGGIVMSGDSSGNLSLLSGATTVVAVTATGATVTGTLAATGAITPSQTAGVIGTTTNNSANAGSIGEYVSSTVAPTGTSLAVSGTVYNVTSISLTAGDWDVSGIVYYDSAAGLVLVAYAQSGISTVSATLSGTYPISAQTYNSTIASISIASQLIGTWRVSLASTTTIYLVARAGWTVQTPFAFGTLRARRVR